jgi:hypothetical protein
MPIEKLKKKIGRNDKLPLEIEVCINLKEGSGSKKQNRCKTKEHKGNMAECP